MPPGATPTLWNADQRFREVYLSSFPGYYQTADAGYIDEAGYVFVMGRTDGIINVAGHRLSTGAMEEDLAAHPDVAKCGVIGVVDALKGAAPRIPRPESGRAAPEPGHRCGDGADGPRIAQGYRLVGTKITSNGTQRRAS